MPTHDLTTLYTAKAVEYLIAVSYLLLFIPFWKYVNGGKAAPALATARASVPIRTLQDWFELPAQLLFHPGHAWARVDGADTVTIGMDDFARKLVGRLDALNLPKPGDRLTQGEPAWTLMAGSTPIGMLSPVDGTVIAVNDEARAHPGLVHQDPYEKGWLLKLKSPRLAVNLKHLLSGSLARSWMNGVTDALRLKTGPELGLAYEDGGVPVDGFARSLDSRRWDAVAREFLLTDEGGPHA